MERCNAEALPMVCAQCSREIGYMLVSMGNDDAATVPDDMAFFCGAACALAFATTKHVQVYPQINSPSGCRIRGAHEEYCK